MIAVSWDPDVDVIRFGDYAMSRDVAFDLAVQIVFLLDGNLVLKCNNKGVQQWNPDAKFFKTYEKRFNTRNRLRSVFTRP